MSFNSSHAEEFRFLFNLKPIRSNRITQRTLIAEEYSEFMEAERHIYDEKFRANDSEALKELADLVYVCFQYAANMEWDLDQALLVFTDQTFPNSMRMHSQSIDMMARY